MRTWSIDVPPAHHALGASFEALNQGQPDDKKRVPVPTIAGSPHALAKETGCPVGIIARRTAAPLAQSARYSKFSKLLAVTLAERGRGGARAQKSERADRAARMP